MKLSYYPTKKEGKKIIFIVIDGLGDRPAKVHKGKTPLELAKTPNLDYFAKNGRVGLHYPLIPGLPVGSGMAHLALFGYSPEDYPGRGVLEALGLGIELDQKTIAFRINFCTVNEEFIVLDRRAGRNDYLIDQLTEKLNKAFSDNPFNAEIKIYKGKEYRGVLIIKVPGRDLELIPDTDPQEVGKKIIFPDNTTLTGRIVNWIIRRAYDVLNNAEENKQREEKGIPKANCILLRGAGKLKKIVPFYEKYGLKAAAIADAPLYLGVAKYVGMDVYRVEKDEEKIQKALELIEKYDFIFIHFKKADSYGEDGKVREKIKYIEFVDRLLKPLRKFDGIICITADHATPCTYKQHSGDYVPIVIYNPEIEGDKVKKFCEKECRKGSLGIIPAYYIMPILLNEAKRLDTFAK